MPVSILEHKFSVQNKEKHMIGRRKFLMNLVQNVHLGQSGTDSA